MLRAQSNCTVFIIRDSIRLVSPPRPPPAAAPAAARSRLRSPQCPNANYDSIFILVITNQNIQFDVRAFFCCVPGVRPPPNAKIRQDHMYFQPPSTQRFTSLTSLFSLSDPVLNKLIARPARPPLAVRPTRCKYSTRFGAIWYSTTNSTCWRGGARRERIRTCIILVCLRALRCARMCCASAAAPVASRCHAQPAPSRPAPPAPAA